MSLIFENELHDMTPTAKPLLLDHDEVPWRYTGDVVFEEVPYFGYRTDLVTVRIKHHSLARRRDIVGHARALPDERKYRRSYRKLQTLAPISRNEWVHKDNTYHTEQTCREVWDWLREFNFIRPVRDEELGFQETLTGEKKGGWDDHTPAVAVQVPDVVDVTAWELKQRDWETALRQAIRADCYADHRMVLLDGGDMASALENKKQFSDAGVGLASLTETGVEVHWHPDSVHPPHTSVRHLLNERAIERAAETAMERLDDE